MTRTNRYFNRRVIIEDFDGTFKNLNRTVYEDSVGNFYIVLKGKMHFVSPDVNKPDFRQPDVTWFSVTI